jgi:ABC-2 type transport system permease protein
MNPGIGVASDRLSGWLRVKKVSAAPIGAVVAGKLLAALPYAVGVLLALSVTSLAISGPTMGFGTWLALMGVLLLGSLPFALFGLAVGFVTSANATAAVLNAVFFPMVVASGLWFPLEMMPGFVQGLAPFLPTYHLGQLAAAQFDGGPVLSHVLALLLTTLVTGGLATWSYRRLRV